MFGTILVILLILFVVAVVVWNFVPSIRKKLRGWTTVLEGAVGSLIWLYGNITDALQEAQKAGYLPTQLVSYVPVIILVWLVIKRVHTNTPVGKK